MIKEFIKARSFLSEERIVKATPTNVYSKITLEVDDYG